MSGDLKRLVIPGTPMGKQRARVVRSTGRIYTPEETRSYEAHAIVCSQEQWDGPPLTGPTRVDIAAWFPRPKSMFWKRKHMPSAWCPKKPDIDNVEKIVLDALVGAGVLLDDAIVVAIKTRKRYVDGYGNRVPHVLVCLSDPGVAGA